MISERFAEFLSRLRRGVAERDRERLAAILELNRGLAAAQDHSDLLSTLLDAAIQLFSAERGFLILREGDHTDFRGSHGGRVPTTCVPHLRSER